MITLQVVYPDDKDILRYKLFNHGRSKKITANPAVEQLVTKILLTDPGSDVFDPTQGAGLRRVLSSQVSEDNEATLTAEIGTAIIRTEEQIIASQSDLALDPSETLISIDVRRLKFEDGVWIIDLKLNMADGNVQRVLLEQ